MFSLKEKKWIEDNSELIESGSLSKINEVLPPEMKVKLLLYLGYIIGGGPEAFEFKIVDKGLSRSLHRANVGQHILRILLFIKPIPGSNSEPIQVNFWKGTFNPDSLKKLMGPAFHKWLYEITYGAPLEGLEGHLMNNTDWGISK